MTCNYLRKIILSLAVIVAGLLQPACAMEHEFKDGDEERSPVSPVVVRDRGLPVSDAALDTVFSFFDPATGSEAHLVCFRWDRSLDTRFLEHMSKRALFEVFNGSSSRELLALARRSINPAALLSHLNAFDRHLGDFPAASPTLALVTDEGSTFFLKGKVLTLLLDIGDNNAHTRLSGFPNRCLDVYRDFHRALDNGEINPPFLSRTRAFSSQMSSMEVDRECHHRQYPDPQANRDSVCKSLLDLWHTNRRVYNALRDWACKEKSHEMIPQVIDAFLTSEHHGDKSTLHTLLEALDCPKFTAVAYRIIDRLAAMKILDPYVYMVWSDMDKQDLIFRHLATNHLDLFWHLMEKKDDYANMKRRVLEVALWRKEHGIIERVFELIPTTPRIGAGMIAKIADLYSKLDRDDLAYTLLMAMQDNIIFANDDDYYASDKVLEFIQAFSKLGKTEEASNMEQRLGAFTTVPLDTLFSFAEYFLSNEAQRGLFDRSMAFHCERDGFFANWAYRTPLLWRDRDSISKALQLSVLFAKDEKVDKALHLLTTAVEFIKSNPEHIDGSTRFEGIITYAELAQQDPSAFLARFR